MAVVLRLRDVEAKVGLKRSTIYAMIGSRGMLRPRADLILRRRWAGNSKGERRMKTETASNPIKEIFGDVPLGTLSSAELRAGIERLKEMQRDAQASLAEAKRRFRADIASGSADFSGVSPEWKRAEHLLEMLAIAIDAVGEAAEEALRREEDEQAIAVRGKIEEIMAAREKVAAEVSELCQALGEKIMECDRLAGQILSTSGVRLTSTTAASLQRQHIKHLLEIELHTWAPAIWPYDRAPISRGHISFEREARNVHGNVLSEFEDRWEKKYGRMIDWARSGDGGAGQRAG